MAIRSKRGKEQGRTDGNGNEIKEGKADGRERPAAKF